VVGEGANLEEFHPGLDGGGFRAEFRIPPKSPLFGVIAMMRPEKGQRTFINAAARVLKSAPDARFVLVGGGGGPYVDKLYEKIRRKFPWSPSPVTITGYREDVSQVMAALDVVVVPSLHDAQTIVIPEAFAAGRPVIASRVGGIPELVTHEENGLLVEPADNDALAAAMLRLLADPVLRNDLASAGHRLARRELSFERKTELLLDSYDKACCRSWANAPNFTRESSLASRAP
jgi:glycosyltransferase involved in cell wall biosynthesis